jgi:hypothetical protein
MLRALTASFHAAYLDNLLRSVAVRRRMMVKGDQLKEAAIAILENLLPEIEMSLYRLGRYSPDEMEAARSTIEDFQIAVLDNHKTVNPEYWSKSEFAAELVYFAHTFPEHFSLVFDESEMTWHRDIDVRMPGGLFNLWTFYSSLVDDHSYSLDTDGNIPKLKGDWQFAGFKPLTCLEEIIPALQNFRETVEKEIALGSEMSIGHAQHG